MRASGLRSDIVCAQSCFTGTDKSASNPFSVALGAPESIPHVLLPWHSQHGGVGPAHHLPVRAAQIGRRPDSSNRRLVQKAPATNMGHWRTIAASTQGVFQQRYLLHELMFAGSQPPAAAATDQVYYPDSSPLVRRPDSSSVRAGSLAWAALRSPSMNEERHHLRQWQNYQTSTIRHLLAGQGPPDRLPVVANSANRRSETAPAT